MGLAGWRPALGMAGVALTLMASPVQAGEMRREAAGTTPAGAAIEAITLTNARGLSARILTFGATLDRMMVPDRQGRIADVLLGYDSGTDYAARPNYWGATVGRYANRIAGGTFALDGKTYRLPLNDKTNSLHGGGDGAGFDRAVWQVASASGGAVPRLVLTHRSRDGEGGYPGQVDATVTYTLDDAGALTIAFDATTTRPTIINMTNHAIFNLAGEGSPLGAMTHRLTIPATTYTPVDQRLIPTGERRPVAGTPFDFRQPRIVGDGVRDGRDGQIRYGHGYDHNFAIDAGLTAQPKLLARLEDPASGRRLEVLSTEPGVQFYTANFLDGTFVGKHGHLYRMGDGIALEPQKFPDAPNHPDFVSARVDPGKPYRHVMVYRFTVAP